MSDLHNLLKDLIATPSVNPAFGGDGEATLVKFVRNWLGKEGITVETQEVFPGRHNLIARIGEKTVPAVMLEAHMDTVGVEGWASGSPFDPVEKDGRIYGRGACDTKASLAVFMAVARHAYREGSRTPLVFAATIDEEEKQTGAYRLMEKVGPLAGAITGEPTQLDIIHAHKGVLRFRVHARGTAAHSAFPERGCNAIFRMGHALAALEKQAADLAAREPDPALGLPTLNVGVIRGGQSVNVVPDGCRIEIDRRLLPSESGEAAFAEVSRCLTELDGIEVEEPYLNRPGMETDRESPFSRSLRKAVEAIRGTCSYSTAPYMTNAAAYAAAGVRSLVFGPGDIAQAHTRDEFVEAAQLDEAFEILKTLLAQDKMQR